MNTPSFAHSIPDILRWISLITSLLSFDHEEKNIIPNEKYADYVINSFLPYELGVIKPYLLKIVSFDFEKEHEKELYEQICFEFKNIIEIPSRFIPSDSVFREFIGNESWF